MNKEQFAKTLWLFVAGEISILCGAIAYLAYLKGSLLGQALFFSLGTMSPAFMVAKWKRFLVW